MAKKKVDLSMVESVLITEIKPNDANPRFIRDEKYEKLVKSIKDFPQMLALRPIIVNKQMVVLGGNMRLRACKEAGLLEVPVIHANKLTKDQQDEFIIKDNVGFGEWDMEMIANEWDDEKLVEWGMDLVDQIEEEDERDEQPEVEFSEVIDEEQNYVVLTFDNSIDWLSAQTHFNVNTVYSQRQNGKEWSKGVGRVIDGAKYLKDLADGNI